MHSKLITCELSSQKDYYTSPTISRLQTRDHPAEMNSGDAARLHGGYASGIE